jgi:hypothetical protein
MFNDLEHLRDDVGLFNLLTHYADLAGPDRQAWQDRCMRLEACEPAELIRLHGWLIGSGWLEQNTGVTPGWRKGEAPGCYRITPAGLRALKQVRSGELDAA